MRVLLVSGDAVGSAVEAVLRPLDCVLERLPIAELGGRGKAPTDDAAPVAAEELAARAGAADLGLVLVDWDAFGAAAEAACRALAASTAAPLVVIRADASPPAIEAALAAGAADLVRLPEDAPWLLARARAAAHPAAARAAADPSSRPALPSWIFDVIARDLNARRQADEELRRSEERFSKIFHASPACITVTRLSDNTFVDVNERFLAAVGMTREEVIGKTGVALGLWQSPGARDELERAIRSGQPVRDVEVRLVRKSGEPLDLLMSLETFSAGGEELVFALSHDVTERKRLEHQLRHTQKMDAIGRLAGGIAHDFNNILTAMRGYADILLAQLEPGTPTRDAAEHIRRSAQRASSLTEQLLVFTRREPAQARVVDLNEVVRSMGALLMRIIGEDIEFALRLWPDLGRVRVDPTQIEQVLLNLAVNARDAMPTGGRLTIETADEGDRVRLSVTDSGAGMSAETQQRIFEPFFTTKEVGKGTGLGLSIVYGVITQSGGTIRVDSAPGRGAAFHIFLPRVESAITEAAGAAPGAVRREPGRETILLVEDDEDVRDFVQFVLRQAGYDVLLAEDGVAALAVAREYAGEIHLLLSDIVMPQLNGLSLTEQLLPRHPNMKVLHMSGYPGDRIARPATMPASIAFLQKPFSADLLTSTIRTLLEDRLEDGPGAAG